MTKFFASILFALLIYIRLNDASLNMATFNIQVFGQKKLNKENVKEILIKILKRYHLIFIQEIRDSKGTAFAQLVNELNSATGKKYKFVESQRLGKSASKEQYGVIYDPNVVTVEKTYQDPDPERKFERPPFALLLKLKKTRVKHAAFIVTHIDPDVVVEEMEALYDVAKYIRKTWNEPIMILGDMNADCSYLSQKKYQKLTMKVDKDYHWLMEKGKDTTVGSGDCAYDRIIVNGWKPNWINVPSIKAFKFDEAFKLTTKEAKEVSDHYPVELQLL